MEVKKNKILRNPSMNLDKNYSYYLYEPELKKRHQKAIPNELMHRYFTSLSKGLIKKLLINGLLNWSESLKLGISGLSSPM